MIELAGRLQAPIGHTLRGKDWIQFDNPFDVGMTGLLGYGACYQAMHEADLLLLLGTDFPYDTFLPQAHTIQIDRDPAWLGRRTPWNLPSTATSGRRCAPCCPRSSRRPPGNS